MTDKIMDSYTLVVDEVPVNITIKKVPQEFVPIYDLTYPNIEKGTEAVLDSIRERMIDDLSIKPIEIIDPEEMNALKKEFDRKSNILLSSELPNLEEGKRKILAGILVHKCLGLGSIEVTLQDRNLEEVVINNAKEPVWVYHRRIGWLKTNIFIPSEADIYNYAALIGRRVGTQITHLNPLMDAYLSTGDRSNATLFPISAKGNTLTIRKFARKPWTITDFIETGVLSVDAAAFLWLAIQYELNIVIAGGTASGKTSLLNVLTSFIPPNHRIISIEDTRELQLAKFLHWVPLTTRPANAEGRGEITMLELMINALRMRPDRMIVGEIRRKREAQVLFEAIHTGHSVYSTLHANTSEEALRRLINPPINIPVSLLTSLQLVAVMHRDRRRDIRRVLQISELMTGGMDDMKMELNTVFRWIPQKDQTLRLEKSLRVFDDIKLFTGMDDDDITKDLEGKKKILNWLVKNKVSNLHTVGGIISEYYRDPKVILEMAEKNRSPPKNLESPDEFAGPTKN